MKGIVVFAVLIFASVNAGIWTPIDWKTIPAAAPSDKIEFWYVTAPLMEESYGEWLGYADLFHAAVAFVNKNSNVSFTLNYDADNFMRSNLFPEIVTYENGTKGLKWDNTGALYVYNGVQWDYFHSNHTLVAKLNGTQYNSFMKEWIANVNGSHPYYDMFGLKNGKEGKEWIPSYDCFDFAFDAALEMRRRGIPLLSTTLPKNEIDIYTASAPQPLEWTDDTREEIVKFYELTTAAFSELSFGELLAEIWTTLRGKWISRIGTQYYSVQMKWPYFGIHFGNVRIAPIPTMKMPILISN